MSRAILAVFLTVLMAAACQALPPIKPETLEPDEVLFLWPEGPPGGVPAGLTEKIVERDNPFGLLDRAAHDVTAPSLSVFRPVRSDGSAILIIPGGGYKWVVIDKEGFEGARHFAEQGATVYVLRYSLPHQGWQAGPDTPLQDAQRAVRIIRSRASIDSIDPTRVLVMGFSAGGHVAGTLQTGFDAQVYDPVDATDMLSARPDATALIYPVVTMRAPLAHPGSRLNLIGEAPSPEREAAWSLESRIFPGQPPVFLMHAEDDKAVPVENAAMLYSALRAADVPVAMHLYETGGHGFGLRGIAGTPLETWPGLLTEWGRAHGIFPVD